MSVPSLCPPGRTLTTWLLTDWERVARILAEKLEVAVQETAAMKEERDLSAAQLRRLEKIVETHGKCKIESVRCSL